MEQLEYQLQRDNEMARQQIAKAIADRYGPAAAAAAGAVVRPAAWNHDHRAAVVVPLVASHLILSRSHPIASHPIISHPTQSHHTRRPVVMDV